MARRLVLALSLAFACQSAMAQAMYRIIPLGYLGGCTTSAPVAYGFNGSDQVTGQACNANGDSHAFLWTNNGNSMVDLGPPEVGSASYGAALEASGLVAGSASDSTGNFVFESLGGGASMTRIYNGLGGTQIAVYGANGSGQLTGDASLAGDIRQHAFLWKNDGSPMLDLGDLRGNSSTGAAINAAGQVAGFAYFPVNTDRAFIWKNDGSPMLDLGTFGGTYSSADFINASGQVAGISTVGTPKGAQHAFIWRNDGTPIQDLGTLGGEYVEVHAFNDSGQVAGSSLTHKRGSAYTHAFVWLNDGTPMKDLGTLGGTHSQSNDINASGQVTGYAEVPAADAVLHAFRWTNDGTKIRDLNKLIDLTDPLKPYVTLTSGDLINDRSDIVAEGTDSRTGLGGLYLLKGTGVTNAVLTLAPRSLAFGDIPITTSSATQSVTVTNTSAKAVAITGIALRGTAPKQFAFTDDCGKSLAGHATCTLKAQFTPSTKGAKTAYLDVNGGGGGSRSVKLTGTGT